MRNQRLWALAPMMALCLASCGPGGEKAEAGGGGDALEPDAGRRDRERG